MKTIRELIDKSWDLVENNQIDGDLLPCLDDCEQEFMDAESKLNKLLICDVMQQRELLIAYNVDFYKGIHDVTIKDIELNVDKYLSNL